MEEIRVEIRFRYEGAIGYHYVVEKRKDAATAFTFALKAAETYFKSCGWKKVELISVGRCSNPNSPPETNVLPPIVPSAPAKPKRAPRSTSKASPAKPKRAATTRRRTKPAAKAEPAKRTRKTTRKPKS